MRQKVLIAMALSCAPRVLIVDEPTMALDASAKQQIVSLLLDLQQKERFAMLVISHELQIIRRMTSEVMVMYAGSIMEEGATRDVLNDPMHPYTRGLVYSSPAVNPFRDMWGIPGSAEEPAPGECPFYSRCSQRMPECRREHPALERIEEGRKVACVRGGIVTLLQGEDLHKSYHVKKRVVPACQGCSLRVKSGEVAALIGESGSGKTTMGELLSGALAPDRGRIRFEGREVVGNSETSKPGGIQMVFQDPLSATNGRLSIGEAVREPLDIIREGAKAERIEAVRTAMKHVMLPASDDFLSRPCRALSGGQRQRVAIARGLVMKPRLLIADEISAMLDPSTGANILRLLKGLQNEYGFAMLFITHDLAMARKISDRVFVMHEGRIIEQGTIGEVFTSPGNDYTRKLLANAKLEGGNGAL
jgi:peptide/nickel transport system ATP-binding protein